MALQSRFLHFPVILASGFFAVALTLSSCAPTSPSTENKETKPKTTAKPTVKPKPKLGIGKYDFIRPKSVKGIYLTAWSAGSRRKMDSVVGLVRRTELNSVVIDIRDAGEMYFKTGISDADVSHATTPAVLNPEALMKRLRKENIWPIARIAVFRDNFVPSKFKYRAVQRSDGSVWRDRGGYSWLDPYSRANWDYIAETVDYALKIGFPEIQLDYVRFPSEGDPGSMKFPGKKDYNDPKAEPAEVIRDFAEFIGKRVRSKKAQYSADIFGIISSSTKKDQGIGQQLEQIAAPFDVISPMVYPSHYARGEYGIANPNASPYAIVKKSLQDYKARVPKAKVRPWLQDFSLGVRYGAKEVKAQIKAVRDVGYDEYLLWNAASRYTESGIAKAKP